MARIIIGKDIQLGNGIKVGGWNTLPYGGTTTTIGSYRIHTFTTTGQFVVPSTNIGTMDILLVGAGGGSVHNGTNGAGGAGGLVYKSAYSLSPGGYTVTIGQGVAGANGQDTSITESSFSLVAIGGGRGGVGAGGAGSSGGSGGGGGNTGGAGGATLQASSFGGAGSAGGNFLSSGSGGGASGTTKNGLAYDISGTSTYYGGGGGNGRSYNQSAGGLGGLGGGGNGADSPAGRFPTAGAPNTGGGAGGQGGAYQDLAGGSGIVIIRYLA